MSAFPRIKGLDAGGVTRHRDTLAALLCDAVDSGASIGFLPPLAVDEARAYWDTVGHALDEGSRVLLASWGAGDRLVGSVQLELAMRATAGIGPR